MFDLKRGLRKSGGKRRAIVWLTSVAKIPGTERNPLFFLLLQSPVLAQLQAHEGAVREEEGEPLFTYI